MATGMELVNAIRAGEAAPPPGIATLGLDRTHHWITSLEPGRVELVWQVEPAYANLEGAVLCSWLVALADQALFFAAKSLCGEAEETRMSALTFEALENVYAGELAILGVIDDRKADAFSGVCTMTLPDGTVAARVSATISVVS